MVMLLFMAWTPTKRPPPALFDDGKVQSRRFTCRFSCTLYLLQELIDRVLLSAGFRRTWSLVAVTVLLLTNEIFNLKQHGDQVHECRFTIPAFLFNLSELILQLTKRPSPTAENVATNFTVRRLSLTTKCGIRFVNLCIKATLTSFISHDQFLLERKTVSRLLLGLIISPSVLKSLNLFLKRVSVTVPISEVLSSLQTL